MGDPLFNNIILFRAYDGPAVLLRPDGDWTHESGIKPSVFSAVCAYSEFEKFMGEYDRYGQLEFYFAGNPVDGPHAADLVLGDWRLVDIQAGNYQFVEGVGVRVIEYQLAFADTREALVGARGGVLVDGEINKTPLSKDGNTDGQSPAKATQTTRQLVQRCIEAMGISCSVPQELSDAPYSLDIDWRGNSAPEELEKLLTEAGFVFLVRNNGDYAIEKRGKGSVPDQPEGRMILDAAYPGLDRRGGSVIFSSAPLAVVNTADYSMDDFEWVMLDTADEKTGRENWVELSKSALLKGLDPIDVIKKDYEPVAEKNRRRVQNFLYAALRLKADSVGPQPMLRFNYDAAAALTQISVLANTIKSHLPTGSAVMYEDLTEIPPTQLMGDGTVLVLPEPLGKLKDGKSEGDFATDFVPLETDDLKIRLTREVYDPNDDGTWRPRFYRVGYKQELGRIVKMSEREIDATLADGKTGFYSMPQLRLYQVDGQDRNRQELEGIGFGLAERFVGGSGNGPRIVAVAGYAPADLSGQVNSVTWSFAPPKTTWKANTWYMPHEFSQTADPAAIVLQKKGGGGGKFPKAAETANRRTAEGIAGGQQPSVVLNPKATPPATPTAGIVKITARGDHGAWYTGVIQKGSATIEPTTNFRPNNNGAITGMTDGAAVNVLNLLEGGSSHMLSLPCYAPYELIGPGDDNRATVAVRVKPAFLTYTVALQWDGGGVDGTPTTAATWTYTARQFGTLTLGTGMSPRWPRALGPRAKATEGLGQLDAEGNFQLVYAHEPETIVPCIPS